MIDIGAISILTLFLILADLEAVTVVIHHPEDEYVLDHEVLRKEALAEAKKLEIHSGHMPGCMPCTNSEMTYCKNGNVINDHCWCDGKHNEVFPFVEHTCRVGPEAYKLHAENCAEYTRLRECCCHSYLVSVWKDQASSASHASTNLTMFLPILTIVMLHLWLT